MVKITDAKREVLLKYITLYPTQGTTILGRTIIQEATSEEKKKLDTLSVSSIQRMLSLLLKQIKEGTLPQAAINKNFEINDKFVINKNTNTIITDLGEFGEYVCSLDRHKAIQRAYVWQGEGQTAAEVAMNFNFPHAKAVHLYAKIHGFTKASVPQTDIEIIKGGMTVDQAVTENLQTFKRKVHKETEKNKWKLIQENSNKWEKFDDNVIIPFKNYLEETICNYKPIKLDIRHLSSKKSKPFASVMGLSDWHYMKLCYNHDGTYNYNKQIARDKIKRHSESLLSQQIALGKPERIFVPIGNDNIHIDSPYHDTTAGTSQVNATDGIWRIGIAEYMDLTLDYLESIAQIAPVEAINFPGNHDEKTAIMMGIFLERFYKNDNRITITNTLHPRIYKTYGRNCLIFTHGHHLGSTKIRNEIHKIILGEARQHGIDLNNTDNFLLFSGHDHVGSFHDLNGNVQHFIMPSLAGIDDFWHLGQGYVGRAMESALYLLDPVKGRSGILYTSD